MNPHALALLDKTTQALAEARYLATDKRVDAAINRAYYATFHAAQAALLMVGESPKTRTGVKARFSLHFVTSGIVSKEVAAILSDAETMRQQADYAALTIFDIDAAADLIADVDLFVNAIQELMSS